MASFLVRPPLNSNRHVVDLSREDIREMTIEELQWWADYIEDLRRQEKGHMV